jgi:hypothetical protein
MTNLTDYDPENPPDVGTLFKATSYTDENAPIIRFEGQREVRVSAVHPGSPEAKYYGANPNAEPPTTNAYKLKFSTHRAGGAWDEGDVQEIDDRMYNGREDLLEVDEDGTPK